MAATPNIGPNARQARNTGQLTAEAKTNVNCTVTIVSANASAVWNVIRLPACSAGAASATSAENCAESGATERPQMRTIANVSQAGPPKVRAAKTADVPLITMATIAIRAFPQRSAKWPAATQEIALIPIAANAVSLPRSCASQKGSVAL